MFPNAFQKPHSFESTLCYGLSPILLLLRREYPVAVDRSFHIHWFALLIVPLKNRNLLAFLPQGKVHHFSPWLSSTSVVLEEKAIFFMACGSLRNSLPGLSWLNRCVEYTFINALFSRCCVWGHQKSVGILNLWYLISAIHLLQVC